MSASTKLYAPLYITDRGTKFIYAYQDQLFKTEAEAECRGKEVESFRVDNTMRFFKVLRVDLRKVKKLPVIEVGAFKVIFIDEEMFKNARGGRKKRDLSQSTGI